MKALTLWQPCASLVAIKAKPFETRSFPPPAKLIGERIAIHAAVRKPGRLIEDMIAHYGLFVVAAIAKALNSDDWDALPRGAVVCTAVLAGAYQCGTDDAGRIVIADRSPATPA